MRKEAKEEQSAIAASAPTSPSHEFSFTLSFHPSSTVPNKSMNPTSFAADMSPADDIFFHGHLLPLHFLSHIPVTPRSSTDSSSESFSFPIRPDGQEDKRPNNHSNRSNCGKNVTSTRCGTVEGGIKSKPFTLFWSEKWRKSGEVGEKEKEKKKIIMKFKVSCVLKKYFRTLKPFFLLKGRKKNGQLHKQDFSFSRNSSLEELQQWGRATELSAPASIRTSPTNSGFLSPTTPRDSNKNDSTLEELQSAIQAAIIHCKNSIAKEDEKLQSQD